MELLAPAGSIDALRAALYAGADAIYLGGTGFNARQSAANFNFDEIEESVTLAHEYNARIYVTVNTLVNEYELEELEEYLKKLASLNVDAFIIQDLAVAKIARRVASNVEMHASTQMTVHNSAGIEHLKEQGFKRVVLARELDIKTIKEMAKKHSDIGLEVFAHGALCYAYSGQCLMSSMIGGRSGNRGACAGPCRLPYTLYREGEELELPDKYLMSTKDLNTIDELEKMRDANITAIKIEGRMKRPEYVYSVVSSYRQALDNKIVTYDMHMQLQEAFNRDFTKGLIFGAKPLDLMATDRPDNRGVIVAELKMIKNRRQAVATKQLYKNDLLAYRQGGITKTISLDKDIQKGHYINLKGVDVTNDLEISRVKSTKADQEISDLMRRPSQKHIVDFDIKLIEGEIISLIARDNLGNEVAINGEMILPKAHTKAADKEYVIGQLNRLGGTIYSLGETNVVIEGHPAAPARELNNLRRLAIDSLLEKQREKFSFKVSETPLIKDAQRKQKEYKSTSLMVSAENLEEASAAIKGGADYVIYGSVKNLSYFKNDIINAKEILGDKFIWRWPRISQDMQLDALLKLFEEIKPDIVYADNLGQIQSLKDKEIRVISGSGMFPMNSVAIHELNDLGVDTVTLSVELNKDQINNLVNNTTSKLNIVVHEKTLLMINEACILAGSNQCAMDECQKVDFYLSDRMDYQFPLGFDDKCRSYVYNGQDLVLIDELPNIISMKIDNVTLDIGGRGVDKVYNLTRMYRNALDEAQMYGRVKTNYKDEIMALVNNNLTRGHWHRGV
jgi:putative protease